MWTASRQLRIIGTYHGPLLPSRAFLSSCEETGFNFFSGFFHLNDAKGYIPLGQQGYDPLYKLSPLMDIVTTSFKAAYQLGKEIAIDESMIGFKGRVFIQYLPKKPQNGV